MEWKVNVRWSKGLIKGRGHIIFRPDNNNAQLIDLDTNETLFDLTSTINASLLFPIDIPKPFQVKGSLGYWITVINDDYSDNSPTSNSSNSSIKFEISYTLKGPKSSPLLIGHMIQRGSLSLFYSDKSELIHQKRGRPCQEGDIITLGDLLIEINSPLKEEEKSSIQKGLKESWTCLYTKDKHKKLKKWIDATLTYEDGKVTIRDNDCSLNGNNSEFTYLYNKTFPHQSLQEGYEFENASFLFQICDPCHNNVTKIIKKSIIEIPLKDEDIKRSKNFILSKLKR